MELRRIKIIITIVLITVCALVYGYKFLNNMFSYLTGKEKIVSISIAALLSFISFLLVIFMYI